MGKKKVDQKGGAGTRVHSNKVVDFLSLSRARGNYVPVHFKTLERVDIKQDIKQDLLAHA